MGFSSVLMLLVVFGFLVLGPKRMHEMLREIAKMKAGFERSSRELRSRVAAEIEGETGGQA
jgi:Sec-independent protein translocase protein TatA